MVIIGAAGGIGRACAQRLAGRFPLLLLGRSLEPLQSLAAELPDAEAVAVDASDRAALLAAISAFAESRGRPTGLLNCAGSIVLGPAQRTSEAAFLEVLQVNLVTAFNAIAVAQAQMRQGSVVLMSSVAARLGLVNHEAIAAAKAGVEGLVRAAAASGAKRGLRVNGVAPGLVDTPLASGLLSQPAMRQASERMHPLGRIGQPDDIAAVIVHLLDPANNWISGQIIGVDGGLGTLRPPG
ncbi:MAG: SDR family oxidoreductase [Planctomycetota bacterium]|nr:MAG: SDR family oxidoreductase [Planctomycetota bacterium]